MSAKKSKQIDLKQIKFNNEGYLNQEQMEKVFRELLEYCKIVEEFHDADGGGNGIDELEPPILEAKEITFTFSLISLEFSRTKLTGAPAKATTKAIVGLVKEFARIGAPVNHELYIYSGQYPQLDDDVGLFLDLEKSKIKFALTLGDSKAPLECRRQFVQDIIATAELPVSLTESDGKLGFKSAEAKTGEGLEVIYPVGKEEAALSAFFAVCAHKQMRYPEMTWCIRGAGEDDIPFPQLPQVIAALSAAKLTAKNIDVSGLGWSLKRWQDWPLLLTAANHYDKILYLMPFQAAMPSGKEFQLWMNVTPKKGFKFEVRFDNETHINEFSRLITAKMKQKPDYS